MYITFYTRCYLLNVQRRKIPLFLKVNANVWLEFLRLSNAFTRSVVFLFASNSVEETLVTRTDTISPQCWQCGVGERILTKRNTIKNSTYFSFRGANTLGTTGFSYSFSRTGAGYIIAVLYYSSSLKLLSVEKIFRLLCKQNYDMQMYTLLIGRKR